MEQLLSQLGESLSVGDMGELGEGGGEELPREVVQVDQDLLSVLFSHLVHPFQVNLVVLGLHFHLALLSYHLGMGCPKLDLELVRV